MAAGTEAAKQQKYKMNSHCKTTDYKVQIPIPFSGFYAGPMAERVCQSTTELTSLYPGTEIRVDYEALAKAYVAAFESVYYHEGFSGTYAGVKLLANHNNHSSDRIYVDINVSSELVPDDGDYSYESVLSAFESRIQSSDDFETTVTDRCVDYMQGNGRIEDALKLTPIQEGELWAESCILDVDTRQMVDWLIRTQATDETYMLYAYMYAFLMEPQLDKRYRMDVARDAFGLGEYEFVTFVLVPLCRRLGNWLQCNVDSHLMIQRNGDKWQYKATDVPVILWSFGPEYILTLLSVPELTDEAIAALKRALEEKGWIFRDS